MDYPILDGDLLDAVFAGASIMDHRYTGATWYVMVRNTDKVRAAGGAPFSHYEKYGREPFVKGADYKESAPTALKKYYFDYLTQWDMLRTGRVDKALSEGRLPKRMYPALYDQAVSVGLLPPREEIK